MYASAKRTSNPLFVAGLAVFGASLLAATLMNGLHIYVAFIVFCILVLVGAAYPGHMLVAVVVVSILVPLDATINPEKFPRIGPTRLIFAAALLGMLLRWIYHRWPIPPIKRLPFAVPVGLYLAWGVVCAVFSVDSFVSFNAVIGRDIVEQFLLFYMMYYFFNQPSFWPRLTKWLFIATAVVCAVGFYEAVTHSNPYFGIYQRAASGMSVSHFAVPHMDFRAGLLRIRSTFFHPIALGCYLNILLPVAVVYVLKGKSLSGRLAVGVLATAMAAASFLTVSRAPWICLVLELSIIAAWWSFKKMERTALAAVATVFILSAFVFVAVSNTTVNKKLASLANPNRISMHNIDESSSEFYRIALVKTVMDRMHGFRWLYGYGPNAFYLADIKVRYYSHERTLEAPDNNYVRLLLEYGVAGLLLYCLLLGCVVTVSIRRISRMPDDVKLLGVACLASVVGFILVNFTVSMFNMYPLGFLFWMMVARILTLPADPESPAAGLADGRMHVTVRQ